jgi:hypothetical protein
VTNFHHHGLTGFFSDGFSLITQAFFLVAPFITGSGWRCGWHWLANSLLGVAQLVQRDSFQDGWVSILKVEFLSFSMLHQVHASKELALMVDLRH